MSTIRTNTLTNVAGSKSIPTDTVVDGSAKAWVNFNGTGTVAIRRAFNVSSITDNGVGDFTLNFINALADANFAVVCMSSTSTGGAGNTVITAQHSGAATTPKTSNAARLWIKQAAALIDVDTIDATIFR